MNRNNMDIYEMNPQIQTLTSKKLVGMRMRMSLSTNRTGELWRNFMHRRREIRNHLNSEMLSMQVYLQPIELGNMNQEFDKWAAIEVTDFNRIPEGMESFELMDGLYAVFRYRGSSTDTRIFRDIYGTWLPHSGFLLDARPHFEILGDKYKNADPNSEEDIWIPVKPKE